MWEKNISDLSLVKDVLEWNQNSLALKIKVDKLFFQVCFFKIEESAFNNVLAKCKINHRLGENNCNLCIYTRACI
jgi:hypothetical protein